MKISLQSSEPLRVLYLGANPIIQICSGIARGRVLNGPEEWREIFMKYSL